MSEGATSRRPSTPSSSINKAVDGRSSETPLEIYLSNERGKILAILEKADELLTPQAIAVSANMAPNNVWRLLGKMVEDDQVVKLGRGRYRHSNREDLTPGKVGQ